jgi:hypothetical protein
MNGTVRLGQFLFRAEEPSPSPVSPSLIRARPAKVSNVTYSGAVAWRFAMARPGQKRTVSKRVSDGSMREFNYLQRPSRVTYFNPRLGCPFEFISSEFSSQLENMLRKS